MSRDDLRSRLRQQPFRPFRLVVTDGVGYDIRHPDLLMVGPASAVVGLVNLPDEDFYHTTVLVDLVHVMRLEPLESPTTAG